MSEFFCHSVQRSVAGSLRSQLYVRLCLSFIVQLLLFFPGSSTVFEARADDHLRFPHRPVFRWTSQKKSYPLRKLEETGHHPFR